MDTNTYNTGDTVRVGKGKAVWTVLRSNEYGVAIESPKGMVRNVDTADLGGITLIAAAPVADEVPATEWVGVMVNHRSYDEDNYGQNTGETSFRCVACLDTDNYDTGVHLLPSEERPACQYCGLDYTLPVPDLAKVGDVVWFDHRGELLTGTVIGVLRSGMEVELEGYHLAWVEWSELRYPLHDAHVAEYFGDLLTSHFESARVAVMSDAQTFAVGDRVVVRDQGPGEILEVGGYFCVRLDTEDCVYAVREWLTPITVTMEKTPRYAARQAVRMAQVNRTVARIMRDVTDAVTDGLSAIGVDPDTAYDDAKTITSHIRENRLSALHTAFALAR